MIILASASPRRQELLKLICDSFAIEPADIDETVNVDIRLDKTPEYLATEKARFIHNNNHYDDIVIGCDTGVFLDNIMLGKPKDKEDAKKILSSLSGRKHKAITGCSIFYKDKAISFSQTTYVEFYELTNKEIEEYIATEEHMDKAGAYGIQGKGAKLVKKIDGDFYNVVGLPIALLNKNLNKLFDEFNSI